MQPNIVNLKEKKLERDISRISAAVADAVDTARRIRKEAEAAEETLVRVQEELEEAYLFLEMDEMAEEPRQQDRKVRTS